MVADKKCGGFGANKLSTCGKFIWKEKLSQTENQPSFLSAVISHFSFIQSDMSNVIFYFLFLLEI